MVVKSQSLISPHDRSSMNNVKQNKPWSQIHLRGNDDELERERKLLYFWNIIMEAQQSQNRTSCPCTRNLNNTLRLNRYFRLHYQFKISSHLRASSIHASSQGHIKTRTFSTHFDHLQSAARLRPLYPWRRRRVLSLIGGPYSCWLFPTQRNNEHILKNYIAAIGFRRRIPKLRKTR